MKEKWNERYSETSYAYGEEPNEFLKQHLANYVPGTILFPAEGEGRNAVYAARQGWQVAAFDISEEGYNKAMKLASKYQVGIDYEVGELENLQYKLSRFDAMALIFAHFPSSIKSAYHKQLIQYLRPGAVVIFEAFGKKHIDYVTANPEVGGPKEIDMLFSKDEIIHDFNEFDIVELNEKEITLHEGKYHNGLGSVIQFVGIKK